MKTFDEAIKTVLSQDTSEASVKRLEENCMRHLDLTTEVAEHVATQALIRTLMFAVKGTESCECEGCRITFAVGMSAFMNGVRVGVEMERDETGGVKL